MRRYLRVMIVPFFMVFFPALWFVNRNVSTAHLPPQMEPTTGLVITGVAIATVGSFLVAMAMASLIPWDEAEESELTFRQRLFQPDDTALKVFALFVTISLLFAVSQMSHRAPVWIGESLQLLLIPLAIPFIVLAPLSIFFHWAVIIGLVLSVLWMSLLGNVISDIVHGRSLPLLSNYLVASP